MTELQHRTLQPTAFVCTMPNRGWAAGAPLSRLPRMLGHSWRHRLPALAQAGYRATAPDMRGYGRTDAPQDIEQDILLHLVGDMVGLLDALGVERVVIAGYDWGAVVAWHSALLRPDRFRGVIGLRVPFWPRGTVRPTSMMPQTNDAVWYQLYFQEPGVAEAEYDNNVRIVFRTGRILRPVRV